MTSHALAALFRAVLTALIFLLAYVGFLQAYPPGADGRSPVEYLNLAYKAVQLCFAQFPDDLDGKPIPLALQISRLALPVAAAGVTLSLAWGASRNRVQQMLMRARGEHLVVFGDGALARGLTAGELARKGKVLAWVDQARGAAALEVEARKGAFIAGGQGELDLAKLGLEKARAFVAAADSDAANLEVAKRVLDYASERRPSGDPLDVIARVDDAGLNAALDGRFDRRGGRAKVHLRLASVPQIVARRFLLDNPVDRFRPESGGIGRLVWIGWSPVAERLLVRVLGSLHLRGGAMPELVVADDDAVRAEAAFRARRPGATAIAPVRFVALDDDSPQQVAAWLVGEQRAGAIGAVYVTTEEPSRALSIGLAVETALERERTVAPPIYVHLPQTAANAGAGLVGASALKTFGSLASLSDPEALLQERQDELARAIHEFYLEGRLADGEALGDRMSLAEWEDLPEQVRDDNRLVADCYLVKLRELGARIVEGQGASLRLAPAEIEDLARGEHDRWAAAKLLDGWSHGATRDDRARLHPDLIPYDDLTEATRDLDREQVRIMPRVLAASGRRALRTFVVHLEPSRNAAAPDEIVAALAALGASHPDRAVVVLGDLADDGARAALLAAKAAGHAIALLLRGPTLSILDDLPSAQRDAAAGLFCGADRLYACPRPAWDEARLQRLIDAETHARLSLAPGGRLALRGAEAAAQAPAA